MSEVTLLVVEDNPEDLFWLKRELKKIAGLQIDLRETGSLKQAKLALKDDFYDAVLLDLSLPDIAGIATFEAVAEMIPRTPIIILSGQIDVEFAVQAVHLGAQDYFVKGHVSTEVLARGIRYAIERKGLENVLRDSEERWRALVTGAPSVVMQIDPSYKITFINGDFVGRAQASLIGMSVTDLYEKKYRAEVLEKMAFVFREGEAIEVQARLYDVNGKEYWYDARLGALHENGRVTHIIAMAIDVTERVRVMRELEDYKQHLEDKVTERTAQLKTMNAELESFCYSVSHDLRAPLRSITGFTRALQEDYADKLDSTAADYMQRMTNAGIRMSEIIDDLMRLARYSQSELERTDVDLGEIFEIVIDVAKAQHPDRVIVSQIAQCHVHADAKLMRILAENLVDNAIKYSDKNSALQLEFGVSVDEQRGSVYYLKDNGLGFNASQAQKMFLPFQRLHTKDDVLGTGIGLATVDRIVKLHDGRIWAESQPGEGAVFYFSLPEK